MWGWLVLTTVLLSAVAHADGGVVRIEETVGDLTVTVFSAPEPLRAGPADVSVLVQRRGTGDAVLDATVTIVLTPPDDTAPRELPATRAAATNKLFYAATVDLPVPGSWGLRVDVHVGGATARVAGTLPVATPLSRLAAIWIWLALPAAAVAVFALHQTLRRRQRGTRGS